METRIQAASSFAKKINVSNGGDSNGSQITTSGRFVYVVWEDSNSGNGDIFFSRSVNNGNSFDTPINLSNTPGTSSEVQIAARGNKVFVAWLDRTSGEPEVFFKRSTNNGMSFGNTINLTQSSGAADGLQLAISGNNVYVVWDQLGQIILRRSSNNASSFSSKKALSTHTKIAGNARIRAIGSNVYLAWEEDIHSTNPEIVFTSSLDSGRTFFPIATLRHLPDSISSLEALEASGNYVYVMWTESLSIRNDDLFLRRSTDQGFSFDPQLNISNTAELSLAPKLAVSGNNVFLVWKDDIPNSDSRPELLFRRSANNGLSFLPTVVLSKSVFLASDALPQIIAKGSRVYVSWPNGHSKIFLRQSANNGDVFGASTNVSTEPLFSGYQQMALGQEERVYVVWTQGFSGGNSDILFKALP